MGSFFSINISTNLIANWNIIKPIPSSRLHIANFTFSNNINEFEVRFNIDNLFSFAITTVFKDKHSFEERSLYQIPLSFLASRKY